MEQTSPQEYIISPKDIIAVVIFAVACGVGWYLYKDLRSTHNTVETDVVFFPGMAPDIDINRAVNSAIHSQAPNPAIALTIKGAELALKSTTNDVDQITQAQQSEAKAIVAQVAALAKQAIAWSAQDIKNYPENPEAFRAFAANRLFQEGSIGNENAVATSPVTTVTSLARRRILEAIMACIVGGAAMIVAISLWKFLRQHVSFAH